MEKKKRANINLILSFFIIVLILVSVGIFLFLKGITQTSLIEDSAPPFKVDQILIKVLLKDDESMTRPINIMDISKEDLVIEIKHQYLLDMITVSDSRFTIRPGQTKTVYINFGSLTEEKNIKQEPGAYVGSLLIKSNLDIIKIPVIIEIETKDVLFDANVELPIGQKQIEQGDYLNVHINLFNLKKIGLTNLNMEYFIKDTAGNTIITETESITIETQASFVKTIHIPENLNPGEYIFGAVARYGSSVGTSTLLFGVAKPALEKESLINFYRNNELLSWILLLILAITISVIGSYISFLIGTFIHRKVTRQFSEELQKSKEPAKKKEEKRVVKKEARPKAKFKHKKLFLMLLIIFALAAIIAYLVYSRIITLEKLAYLWNLAIGWFKKVGEKILPYTRNLWKTALYYASPQRRYFYHIFGITIALIALICFVIIAKKTYLFERLKIKPEERKAKRAEKKLVAEKEIQIDSINYIQENLSKGYSLKAIRKVFIKQCYGKTYTNNLIKTYKKHISKKEKRESRINVFEKIKKTIKMHKVLFIVLVILVVCCITWGILFYLGIISTLYITEFVNNIIPFVQEIGQNIASIMRAYYVYVILFLVSTAIISILYLKRESLAGVCWELKGDFKELPIRGKIIILVLVVTVLLIILTSILIALGYINIVPK